MDEAFRVWQTSAPSTNDTPPLVCGQTVTNYEDSVNIESGTHEPPR